MCVSWKHRVAHSLDLQQIVQEFMIVPRSLQVLTSTTLWDALGQTNAEFKFCLKLRLCETAFLYESLI